MGKLLGGHAAERALKRLVGRFAEIRDRRDLLVGGGIGGVERQVGGAALAGPLACAFEQQVGGLVDLRGAGRRRAIDACIVQDIAGDREPKQRKQSNGRDQEITNIPDGRNFGGRIYCEMPSSRNIGTKGIDAEIAKRGTRNTPRRS